MKSILIVDDEPEQIRSLRVGLGTKGFDVIGVSNAHEAIRHLKDYPDRIGLVVTDYAMAEMNGLMLLEKIKEMADHIPVIMMTAYGDKSLVVQALKLGCNGFIEKPFSLEQVCEEIWRV